ncbi:hypothetical protein TELCIR_01079 [Teladorsagia circumcincta]|uniref:SSD domain-containing protein n=1 Tax=Teladorsagia circumcincta TaxID=45464 RepID=A0A2G9V2V8_TELCI|nr:hypothetical protein TELCIR_01079 [Teladorsagia circumcincta]
MSGFCLCTCLAIFLDFLLEFLIFAPMIVLFYGEREEKPKLQNSAITWESYTNMLLSPFGRFIVVITALIIYLCAFIGVSGMKPSFDPSKTFPSDSDLMLSLRKFEKVQSEYAPINFISLLPSLADYSEKANFFEMIGRLEHSEGCYGPERTQLMLRQFIEWGESQNITNLSYQFLPKFLSDRQIKDGAIVQYKTKNGTVDDVWLNYIVICRGELDWNKRAMKIDKIRKIIDDYPQFRTSLFDYDSTIYDLIITVKDELTKAVAITFACMTVACAFMIPSFSGASVATLSMLSISFCRFLKHFGKWSLLKPEG